MKVRSSDCLCCEGVSSSIHIGFPRKGVAEKVPRFAEASCHKVQNPVRLRPCKVDITVTKNLAKKLQVPCRQADGETFCHSLALQTPCRPAMLHGNGYHVASVPLHKPYNCHDPNKHPRINAEQLPLEVGTLTGLTSCVCVSQ